MRNLIIGFFTMLLIISGCKKETQEPVKEIPDYSIDYSLFHYEIRPENGDTNVSTFLYLQRSVGNNYMEEIKYPYVRIDFYLDNPEKPAFSHEWELSTYQVELLQGRTYFIITILYEVIWESFFKSRIDSVIYDTIMFKTEHLPVDGIVLDIEGNEYESVKIGNQIWFKQNLNTSTFSNGDDATEYSYSIQNSSWDGRYNFKKYYHQAILDNRNICPDGWHVPTKDELDTLLNYMEKTYGDNYTQHMLINKENTSLFSYNGKNYNTLWSKSKYDDNNIWILTGGDKNSSAIETRINKGLLNFNPGWGSDLHNPVRCIKNK